MPVDTLFRLIAWVYFEWVFAIPVVVYCIALMLFSYNDSDDKTLTLNVTIEICNIIFFIEMCVRLLALPPRSRGFAVENFLYILRMQLNPADLTPLVTDPGKSSGAAGGNDGSKTSRGRRNSLVGNQAAHSGAKLYQIGVGLDGFESEDDDDGGPDSEHDIYDPLSSAHDMQTAHRAPELAEGALPRLRVEAPARKRKLSPLARLNTRHFNADESHVNILVTSFWASPVCWFDLLHLAIGITATVGIFSESKWPYNPTSEPHSISISNGAPWLSLICMLRLVKLVRLASLLFLVTPLKPVLTVISRSMANVARITMLVFVFIVLFALFGMLFFGGDPMPSDVIFVFNDFWSAFASTIFVLFPDNWVDWGSSVAPYTTTLFILFPIIFILVVFLIINQFTLVMVIENFGLLNTHRRRQYVIWGERTARRFGAEAPAATAAAAAGAPGGPAVPGMLAGYGFDPYAMPPPQMMFGGGLGFGGYGDGMLYHGDGYYGAHDPYAAMHGMHPYGAMAAYGSPYGLPYGPYGMADPAAMMHHAGAFHGGFVGLDGQPLMMTASDGSLVPVGGAMMPHQMYPYGAPAAFHGGGMGADGAHPGGVVMGADGQYYWLDEHQQPHLMHGYGFGYGAPQGAYDGHGDEHPGYPQQQYYVDANGEMHPYAGGSGTPPPGGHYGYGEHDGYGDENVDAGSDYSSVYDEPKWLGPGGANYRARGGNGGDYGQDTRRTELSSYDGGLFAQRQYYQQQQQQQQQQQHQQQQQQQYAQQYGRNSNGESGAFDESGNYDPFYDSHGGYDGDGGAPHATGYYGGDDAEDGDFLRFHDDAGGYNAGVDDYAPTPAFSPANGAQDGRYHSLQATTPAGARAGPYPPPPLPLMHRTGSNNDDDPSTGSQLALRAAANQRAFSAARRVSPAPVRPPATQPGASAGAGSGQQGVGYGSYAYPHPLAQPDSHLSPPQQQTPGLVNVQQPSQQTTPQTGITSWTRGSLIGSHEDRPLVRSAGSYGFDDPTTDPQNRRTSSTLDPTQLLQTLRHEPAGARPAPSVITDSRPGSRFRSPEPSPHDSPRPSPAPIPPLFGFFGGPAAPAPTVTLGASVVASDGARVANAAAAGGLNTSTSTSGPATGAQTGTERRNHSSGDHSAADSRRPSSRTSTLPLLPPPNIIGGGFHTPLAASESADYSALSAGHSRFLLPSAAVSGSFHGHLAPANESDGESAAAAAVASPANSWPALGPTQSHGHESGHDSHRSSLYQLQTQGALASARSVYSHYSAVEQNVLQSAPNSRWDANDRDWPVCCLSRSERFRRFRKHVHALVINQWFSLFSALIVMLDFIACAYEGPSHRPPAIADLFMDYENKHGWADGNTALSAIELATCILFVLKSCIFFVHYGHRRFFRSVWCVLDVVITALNIVAMVPITPRINAGFAMARPIRLVTLLVINVRTRVIVDTLFRSVPAIAPLAIIFFLVTIALGSFGVYLWSGQLYKCNDTSVVTRDECVGFFYDPSYSIPASYMVDPITGIEPDEDTRGRWMPRRWTSHPMSFNNIITSVVSLLKLINFDEWADLLPNMMHINGVNLQPESEEPHSLLMIYIIFFAVYFLFSNAFAIQLGIAVVYMNFERVKSENDGTSRLSEAQRDWVNTRRSLFGVRPISRYHTPVYDERFPAWVHSVRVKAFELISRDAFRYAVGFAILLAVVCSCLISGVNDNLDKTRLILIDIVLGFYSIEAVIKLVGLGWKQFLGYNWNRVSLFFGVLSFIVLMISAAPQVDMRGYSLALVSISMMRMLEFSTSLMQLVYQLYVSLPAISAVTVVTLVTLSVFAMVFVDALGFIPIHDPDLWVVYTYGQNANFASFFTSFTSMMRIATADLWVRYMSGTARAPVCDTPGSMEAHYAWVWKDIATGGVGAAGAEPCSDSSFTTFFAYIFFPTTMAIMSFLVFPLFTAIVLQSVAELNTVSQTLVKREEFDEFVEIWALFDSLGDEYIPVHRLPTLLRAVGGHLSCGAGYKVARNYFSDVNQTNKFASKVKNDGKSRQQGMTELWRVLQQLEGQDDDDKESAASVQPAASRFTQGTDRTASVRPSAAAAAAANAASGARLRASFGAPRVGGQPSVDLTASSAVLPNRGSNVANPASPTDVSQPLLPSLQPSSSLSAGPATDALPESSSGGVGVGGHGGLLSPSTDASEPPTPLDAGAKRLAPSRSRPQPMMSAGPAPGSSEAPRVHSLASVLMNPRAISNMRRSQVDLLIEETPAEVPPAWGTPTAAPLPPPPSPPGPSTPQRPSAPAGTGSAVASPSRVNNSVNMIDLDHIPDVSPSAFRRQLDGSYVSSPIKPGVSGRGASGAAEVKDDGDDDGDNGDGDAGANKPLKADSGVGPAMARTSSLSAAVVAPGRSGPGPAFSPALGASPAAMGSPVAGPRPLNRSGSVASRPGGPGRMASVTGSAGGNSPRPAYSRGQTAFSADSARGAGPSGGAGGGAGAGGAGGGGGGGGGPRTRVKAEFKILDPHFRAEQIHELLMELDLPLHYPPKENTTAGASGHQGGGPGAAGTSAGAARPAAATGGGRAGANWCEYYPNRVGASERMRNVDIGAKYGTVSFKAVLYALVRKVVGVNVDPGLPVERDFLSELRRAAETAGVPLVKRWEESEESYRRRLECSANPGRAPFRQSGDTNILRAQMASAGHPVPPQANTPLLTAAHYSVAELYCVLRMQRAYFRRRLQKQVRERRLNFKIYQLTGVQGAVNDAITETWWRLRRAEIVLQSAVPHKWRLTTTNELRAIDLLCLRTKESTQAAARGEAPGPARGPMLVRGLTRAPTATTTPRAASTAFNFGVSAAATPGSTTPRTSVLTRAGTLAGVAGPTPSPSPPPGAGVSVSVGSATELTVGAQTPGAGSPRLGFGPVPASPGAAGMFGPLVWQSSGGDSNGVGGAGGGGGIELPQTIAEEVEADLEATSPHNLTAAGYLAGSIAGGSASGAPVFGSGAWVTDPAVALSGRSLRSQRSSRRATGQLLPGQVDDGNSDTAAATAAAAAAAAAGAAASDGDDNRDDSGDAAHVIGGAWTGRASARARARAGLPTGDRGATPVIPAVPSPRSRGDSLFTTAPDGSVHLAKSPRVPVPPGFGAARATPGLPSSAAAVGGGLTMTMTPLRGAGTFALSRSQEQQQLQQLQHHAPGVGSRLAAAAGARGAAAQGPLAANVAAAAPGSGPTVAAVRGRRASVPLVRDGRYEHIVASSERVFHGEDITRTLLLQQQQQQQQQQQGGSKLPGLQQQPSLQAYPSLQAQTSAASGTVTGTATPRVASVGPVARAGRSRVSAATLSGRGASSGTGSAAVHGRTAQRLLSQSPAARAWVGSNAPLPLDTVKRAYGADRATGATTAQAAAAAVAAATAAAAAGFSASQSPERARARRETDSLALTQQHHQLLNATPTLARGVSNLSAAVAAVSAAGSVAGVPSAAGAGASGSGVGSGSGLGDADGEGDDEDEDATQLHDLYLRCLFGTKSWAMQMNSAARQATFDDMLLEMRRAQRVPAGVILPSLRPQKVKPHPVTARRTAQLAASEVPGAGLPELGSVDGTIVAAGLAPGQKSSRVAPAPAAAEWEDIGSRFGEDLDDIMLDDEYDDDDDDDDDDDGYEYYGHDHSRGPRRYGGDRHGHVSDDDDDGSGSGSAAGSFMPAQSTDELPPYAHVPSFGFGHDSYYNGGVTGGAAVGGVSYDPSGSPGPSSAFTSSRASSSVPATGARVVPFAAPEVAAAPGAATAAGGQGGVTTAAPAPPHKRGFLKRIKRGFLSMLGLGQRDRSRAAVRASAAARAQSSAIVAIAPPGAVTGDALAAAQEQQQQQQLRASRPQQLYLPPSQRQGSDRQPPNVVSPPLPVGAAAAARDAVPGRSRRDLHAPSDTRVPLLPLMHVPAYSAIDTAKNKAALPSPPPPSAAASAARLPSSAHASVSGSVNTSLSQQQQQQQQHGHPFAGGSAAAPVSVRSSGRVSTTPAPHNAGTAAVVGPGAASGDTYGSAPASALDSGMGSSQLFSQSNSLSQSYSQSVSQTHSMPHSQVPTPALVAPMPAPFIVHVNSQPQQPQMQHLLAPQQQQQQQLPPSDYFVPSTGAGSFVAIPLLASAVTAATTGSAGGRVTVSGSHTGSASVSSAHATGPPSDLRPPVSAPLTVGEAISGPSSQTQPPRRSPVFDFGLRQPGDSVHASPGGFAKKFPVPAPSQVSMGGIASSSDAATAAAADALGAAHTPAVAQPQQRQQPAPAPAFMSSPTSAAAAAAAATATTTVTAQAVGDRRSRNWERRRSARVAQLATASGRGLTSFNGGELASVLAATAAPAMPRQPSGPGSATASLSASAGPVSAARPPAGPPAGPSAGAAAPADSTGTGGGGDDSGSDTGGVAHYGYFNRLGSVDSSAGGGSPEPPEAAARRAERELARRTRRQNVRSSAVAAAAAAAGFSPAFPAAAAAPAPVTGATAVGASPGSEPVSVAASGVASGAPSAAVTAMPAPASAPAFGPALSRAPAPIAPAAASVHSATSSGRPPQQQLQQQPQSYQHLHPLSPPQPQHQHQQQPPQLPQSHYSVNHSGHVSASLSAQLSDSASTVGPVPAGPPGLNVGGGASLSGAASAAGTEGRETVIGLLRQQRRSQRASDSASVTGVRGGGSSLLAAAAGSLNSSAAPAATALLTASSPPSSTLSAPAPAPAAAPAPASIGGSPVYSQPPLSATLTRTGGGASVTSAPGVVAPAGHGAASLAGASDATGVPVYHGSPTISSGSGTGPGTGSATGVAPGVVPTPRGGLHPTVIVHADSINVGGDGLPTVVESPQHQQLQQQRQLKLLKKQQQQQKQRQQQQQQQQQQPQTQSQPQSQLPSGMTSPALLSPGVSPAPGSGGVGGGGGFHSAAAPVPGASASAGAGAPRPPLQVTHIGGTGSPTISSPHNSTHDTIRSFLALRAAAGIPADGTADGRGGGGYGDDDDVGDDGGGDDGYARGHGHANVHGRGRHGHGSGYPHGHSHDDGIGQRVSSARGISAPVSAGGTPGTAAGPAGAAGRPPAASSAFAPMIPAPGSPLPALTAYGRPTGTPARLPPTAGASGPGPRSAGGSPVPGAGTSLLPGTPPLSAAALPLRLSPAPAAAFMPAATLVAAPSAAAATAAAAAGVTATTVAAAPASSPPRPPLSARSVAARATAAAGGAVVGSAHGSRAGSPGGLSPGRARGGSGCGSGGGGGGAGAGVGPSAGATGARASPEPAATGAVTERGAAALQSAAAARPNTAAALPGSAAGVGAAEAAGIVPGVGGAPVHVSFGDYPPRGAGHGHARSGSPSIISGVSTLASNLFGHTGGYGGYGSSSSQVLAGQPPTAGARDSGAGTSTFSSLALEPAAIGTGSGAHIGAGARGSGSASASGSGSGSGSGPGLGSGAGVGIGSGGLLTSVPSPASGAGTYTSGSGNGRPATGPGTRGTGTGTGLVTRAGTSLGSDASMSPGRSGGATTVRSRGPVIAGLGLSVGGLTVGPVGTSGGSAAGGAFVLTVSATESAAVSPPAAAEAALLLTASGTATAATASASSLDSSFVGSLVRAPLTGPGPASTPGGGAMSGRGGGSSSSIVTAVTPKGKNLLHPSGAPLPPHSALGGPAAGPAVSPYLLPTRGRGMSTLTQVTSASGTSGITLSSLLSSVTSLTSAAGSAAATPSSSSGTPTGADPTSSPAAMSGGAAAAAPGSPTGLDRRSNVNSNSTPSPAAASGVTAPPSDAGAPPPPTAASTPRSTRWAQSSVVAVGGASGGSVVGGHTSGSIAGGGAASAAAGAQGASPGPGSGHGPGHGHSHSVGFAGVHGGSVAGAPAAVAQSSVTSSIAAPSVAGTGSSVSSSTGGPPTGTTTHRIAGAAGSAAAVVSTTTSIINGNSNGGSGHVRVASRGPGASSVSVSSHRSRDSQPVLYAAPSSLLNQPILPVGAGPEDVTARGETGFNALYVSNSMLSSAVDPSVFSPTAVYAGHVAPHIIVAGSPAPSFLSHGASSTGGGGGGGGPGSGQPPVLSQRSPVPHLHGAPGHAGGHGQAHGQGRRPSLGLDTSGEPLSPGYSNRLPIITRIGSGTAVPAAAGVARRAAGAAATAGGTGAGASASTAGAAAHDLSPPATGTSSGPGFSARVASPGPVVHPQVSSSVVRGSGAVSGAGFAAVVASSDGNRRSSMTAVKANSTSQGPLTGGR
jgi:hypothetical protein